LVGSDPGNNSFLILVTVQVLDDPKTQGRPTPANGFQPDRKGCMISFGQLSRMHVSWHDDQNRTAVPLGRKIWRKKPKRFARQLARHWQKNNRESV